MNINANVKGTSKRSLNDDLSFSPVHTSNTESCTKIQKIQNSANVVQKYKMKIPFGGYVKIFAFGVSKGVFVDFVFKNTHKSFDQTKLRIKSNIIVEKSSNSIIDRAKENKGKFLVEMEDGEIKLFDSI